MRLVLSPYEMCGPSAAALTALLIASDEGGVTTLLPQPVRGASPDQARLAAIHTPQYHRLIDAWEWSGPLWRTGLLRWHDERGSPMDEALGLCRRVSNDPDLSPLRLMLRDEVLTDQGLALEAVSRDLLRGGGDPAVSVPIESGLAHYAARRGLPLVRAQCSTSASAKVHRPPDSARLRLTIDVPTAGGGDELMVLREALEPWLVPLRAALDTALAALTRGQLDRGESDALGVAARSFSREFHGAVAPGGYLARGGMDQAFLRPAAITLVASVGPADADLVNAARAIRAMHAGSGVASGASRPATGSGPAPSLAPAAVLNLRVKSSPFDAGAGAGSAA